MTELDREEIAKRSPEEQEAILINTYAQMILDLIKAARIPVNLRLVGALSIALETVAGIIEEHLTPEEKEAMLRAYEEKERGKKEIYLAHNMSDAKRGGTHKVVLTDK